MAGARKPGPQCSHSDPLDVDDGVMSRAQPHLPGPSGITSRVLGDGQRSDTNTVYSRALELAPAALYRETGCAFDSGTLQDLVPVLIQTLTTSISVGGPGATRTGKKDVLSSLGLDFLPDSADSSLGGMIRLLRMGISNMISPGQRRDACRADEIENAAEALAAAAGVYLRLILQGIVAWLLGGTSTLETVASAQGTRLPASTIVSEAAVAQLAGQLRSSKLGPAFAAWIEQNWKGLLTNPQIRVGLTRAGGFGDRVISERRMRAPSDSSRQPATDPPTFSDVNLAAQAAILVAAAAQGAPFCPI